MPTLRQTKLAEAIIVNKTSKKPKNKQQLLESVGYPISTATTYPTKILEQKGVKDSLRALGLTEELITNALTEDIKAKKGNRLGEMRLGAEILGMNENENGGNKTLIINIVPETAQRYAINPEKNSSSST